MRHYNSVFHDLLKRVPWVVFERLVDEHGADRRVRRLPTKSQFIAPLYGRFSGALSLREIEGGLGSHSARLYHVSGRPVQRSILADANARRPSAVLAGLFAEGRFRWTRSLTGQQWPPSGIQSKAPSRRGCIPSACAAAD